MAQLLLAQSCTVTAAHLRTKDLPEICRRADILVAAVGRPEMIKGDWIKPGATVVDVGINRIERDGANKLVGDVDFASAAEVAGAITPVGVGPMDHRLSAGQHRQRLLREPPIAAARSPRLLNFGFKGKFE
jgi:methylenetetrahydrofolate dehydrogenase (NADP+)/methenyltetrahydrofolate cyclohydrolase